MCENKLKLIKTEDELIELVKEQFNTYKEWLDNFSSNLDLVKKEERIDKIVFFFHVLILIKEIFSNFENKNFLSVPILLRSLVECFLKLEEMCTDEQFGMDRISYTDYREKKRILENIEGMYSPDKKEQKLNEISKKIDDLSEKLRCLGKEKDFKLTPKAKEYSKKVEDSTMYNAIFLLSKHTHCNLAQVIQLHYKDKKPELFPIKDFLMQKEFLSLTNFIFLKSVDLFNKTQEIK
ncbi:DUF5677 domain-containing protein [Rodentibacter trehalosifermentans]|uniref:DUF5677 domain-containing protein n=1 Tax=Rodentibacter trehalosifermentans TaxID=1908263 RepID=UPI0009857284|nr:DUF5677 domain-containing protein [Rodentibacter trehalosifermentans]OOF48632.1 hypothetical protein BKK53_09515 [Rodentibacter trehalosifermentans]